MIVAQERRRQKVRLTDVFDHSMTLETVRLERLEVIVRHGDYSKGHD